MDYHRPAPHSTGPASLINDIGIPALSVLLKSLDNRPFWSAVAVDGLLILAFVLYLQHVRGSVPCSLCIFIHLDVLGLVLAGTVDSLAPRSRTVDGIAALGMSAASLGGIYHAWSLVAEEKLTTQGMGSCKMFMDFSERILLDTWLPQVFQPEGLCGEVVWTLLGQSTAVWSLALFVFCLLALVVKLTSDHRTA